MKCSRRTAIKGAMGVATASLVNHPHRDSDHLAAGTDKSVSEIDQETLPDSCWMNLNWPTRFNRTGKDDLTNRTRYPFLDTRQIRELEGGELQFYPAEKLAGPVLSGDQPFESGVSLYGSVIHDGSRFRMWYQPISRESTANAYAVSYAESRDGIKWEKPELGIVEFQGSRRNNRVNLMGHSPSVIDVGTAVPPQRRYLGIAKGWPPKLKIPQLLNDTRTQRLNSYWAFYSEDGLEWTLYPTPQCAVVPHMYDTACYVSDAARGRILGSVKLEPRIGEYDRRSVAITTARNENVLAWESPRLALFPDELDDRMAKDRGCRFAEIYGMGLFAQRDVIIGFPELYWVEGDLHPSQAAGIRLGYHGKSEIQMAYSYNGYSWMRAVGRKPLIPTGEHGDWDDGFLTAQGTAVEVGDEVYIYYSGFRGDHSDADGYFGTKIGLARLRRDGFAAIASDDAAMVEVYHGLPRGESLVVNARTTQRGAVRVEARVPSGKRSEAIEGFTANQCVAIQGDGVRMAVRWADKSWSDLAPDKPIVLRFHLTEAELFAYEVPM